jgi:glycopeptide antibiotics resistance protein
VKTGRGNVRKRAVVVGVAVVVALAHFVTGSAYRGPWPELVNGYLMDILVPFAFYFLLTLPESPWLKPWLAKGLLVFGGASCVEIAQYAGVPIFGQTFDFLDFVTYGLGVALAVLLDTVFLPLVFPFWAPGADPGG